MRLCDHVAQSIAPLFVEDAAGVHRMPCPADDAERVRSVPLRYVLDQSAADHCFAVLSSDTGMFVRDNMALRVPAERFWLEWAERPSDRRGPPRRHGVLVDGAPDGRSGSVRSFWISDAHGVERGQAAMAFDFDVPPRGTPTTIRALARDIGPLAPYVAAEIDPEWMRHFQRSAPDICRAALASVFRRLWTDVAFTLLFSAVLASRSIDPRPVGLDRLNAARSRRGRAPLLDHIDVRLSLGDAAGQGAARGGGDRAMPRLHLVRGHMVRRSGKQFWRCTHMRGDLAAALAPRTVSVTGRRRRRVG